MCIQKEEQNTEAEELCKRNEQWSEKKTEGKKMKNLNFKKKKKYIKLKIQPCAKKCLM